MDTDVRKLKIMIDVYEAKNIDHGVVRDISDTICEIFNSDEEKNTLIECFRDGALQDTNSEKCDTPSIRYEREVLVIDDVIGRQIRASKDTYVIMITSYKSLLTTEEIQPWTWSKYWYGTLPTVKFVLNVKKAKDIRETADFHFEKSKMSYNPYLIITDVEESNKGDTFKLFQDAGFSINKIICIGRKILNTNESLRLMVRMIEIRLWNENQWNENQ